MHTKLVSSPESASTARKALVIALLLATLVQVIVAVRSPTISKDGIVFINMAKGLTQAPAETIRITDQPPGYPAMILVGRKIAALFPGTAGHRQWTIGAQLFSGLGGVLSILLVWLLARRLFDDRVAGVAVILFAALPDFRRNSIDAFADMPHLALYLTAAWTAIEGFSSKNPRWFLASGIASGLAYWIRPEGISAALVIGALLGLMAILRQGETRRFALLGLVATVVCAGVVVTPYPCIKGKITGKKDITRLAHRETWTPPTTVQPSAVQHSPKGQQSTPTESLLRAQANRVYDLAKELFGAFFKALRYFLALPLLIGLIYCRKHCKPRVHSKMIALLVICHTTLLIALYIIANYISVRHTMPIVALTMPWVALGWILCVEWICHFTKRVRTTHAINAFLILFVILMFFRGTRPIHTQRLNVIRAATWMREQMAENEKLLSNSLYAAFHADRLPTLVGSHPNIAKESYLEAFKTHRFIIFDPREHDFKEKWLSHVEETHDLVTVPDMPSARLPLLVYVAKENGPTRVTD